VHENFNWMITAETNNHTTINNIFNWTPLIEFDKRRHDTDGSSHSCGQVSYSIRSYEVFAVHRQEEETKCNGMVRRA